MISIPGSVSKSDSGSDSNKWEGLSVNGFLNHLAYSFFGSILATTIFLLVGVEQIEDTLSKIYESALNGTKTTTTEEEERMFKGIEDGAIANIMTSIDEFKTKYLN